jgi:hypothetical protein
LKNQFAQIVKTRQKCAARAIRIVEISKICLNATKAWRSVDRARVTHHAKFLTSVTASAGNVKKPSIILYCQIVSNMITSDIVFPVTQTLVFISLNVSRNAYQILNAQVHLRFQGVIRIRATAKSAVRMKIVLLLKIMHALAESVRNVKMTLIALILNLASAVAKH